MNFNIDLSKISFLTVFTLVHTVTILLIILITTVSIPA